MRRIPLFMLIATLLGIAIGLLFREKCAIAAPFSDAYIQILKITALPYLVVAILHGVGSLSTSQGKLLLRYGITFVGIVWCINIAMIYFTASLFPEALSTQSTGLSAPKAPSSINFIQLLIPDNIFFALTNNITPAIVVFSLFMGLALMHIQEKIAAMSLLQTLLDLLTKVTEWISWITPLGTLFIIAQQVGTTDLATLKQVGVYLIVFASGSLLLIFWVIPQFVSSLTEISAFRWVRTLWPSLILGYTTNVVIVCLPYIINAVKREIDKIKPSSDAMQSQIQGTTSLIFNLPLSTPFLSLFIFFSAIFFNATVTVAGQIKLFLTSYLASFGAIGIGSWVNIISFLLDALSLPIDALSIFLTTIPFTSGFQSMISVIEIATLSLLITFATQRALQIRWQKLLKGSLMITLPLFALTFTLQAHNPLPKIQNRLIDPYDLHLATTTTFTIHTTTPPKRAPYSGDLFDEILRSKVLRVGYNASLPPFCYRNYQGELVGFDIAYATELAKDLGVSLELIPLTFTALTEDLQSGSYDIAMSAVSVTEERLKSLLFTQPYMDEKMVFVLPDALRTLLRSKEDVKSHPEYAIAAVRGTIFETLAQQFFPEHSLMLLDSYDDFQTRTEAILLWSEPEASAWTILHPQFEVVLPSPSLYSTSLAYALSTSDARFRLFLDSWLTLKVDEGFYSEQYNKWLLGK